ncbi:MAG: hypothetical protein QXU98_13140 [Candidatus Parvarchaeota archaeon]
MTAWINNLDQTVCRKLQNYVVHSYVNTFYSSAIQVKNPQSVSNNFTIYNFRENYAYDLSGWGSGTTDILISYYNVTES